MLMTIWGLSKQAHNDLINSLGEYYTKVVDGVDGSNIDVTLRKSVILKTHIDSVTLDLGGRIATIDTNDFHYIAIS